MTDPDDSDRAARVERVSHRVVVPPPDQRPGYGTHNGPRPPANALAEREARQRPLRELARLAALNDTDEGAPDPHVGASGTATGAPSTSQLRDAPPAGPTRRAGVSMLRPLPDLQQRTDDAEPPHDAPKPWPTPDGIPPLPRPPAKAPAPATSRGWAERVIPWRRDDVQEGRCVSCGSPLQSDGRCPLGHAG